jgi:hypothetical protein
MRAAGDIDGLYVDGDLSDPISEGLQHLYEAPEATVTQATLSPDHRTAHLHVDTDDWDLTIEARTGESLAVGSFTAHNTSTSVYHRLQITGRGNSCLVVAGTVAITELEWGAGGELAAFAADFLQACTGPGQLLMGSIRLHSTKPIVALAATPRPIDLGETLAPAPGETTTVTVTNLGHEPTTLGAAAIPVNPEMTEIVSDGCSTAPLAAGESCDVTVRLTGDAVALDDLSHLVIADETFRGERRIPLTGDTYTNTTTTIFFDPERSYWPELTFLGAIVAPAPAVTGGVVKFTADGPGGDPVERFASVSTNDGEARVIVNVPRGTYEWTATFQGVNAWNDSSSAPASNHTGLVTVTTVAPTINPVGAGDPLALRATTIALQGAEVPDGTLEIRSASGTLLGSKAIDADDPTLEVQVTGLGIGTHDFTARYVTTDDGQPSSGTTRVAVTTKGIDVAWSGEIPTTSGEVFLQRVTVFGDGVYVTGTTNGAVQGGTSAGSADVVVARFGIDGSLTWVRQFGTDHLERAAGVVAGADGVYVSGSTLGDFDGPADGTERGFVARLTLSGEIDWIRRGTESSGGPWQIVASPGGGVVMAALGEATGYPNVGRDLRVLHLRADQSTAWSKTIPGIIVLGDIAADPAGVTVVGAGGALPAEDGVFVRRYAHDGRDLWSRRVQAPYGGVRAYAVGAGSTGILVSGVSAAPIAGQPDAHPDDNPWTRHYTFGGSTVATMPYLKTRLLGSCAAFAGISWTRNPNSRTTGAVISRFGATGVDAWRYEVPGDDEKSFEYLDAAVTGSRAYVVEVRSDFGLNQVIRLRALDGLPAPTGCYTAKPSTSAPRQAATAGALAAGRIPIRLTWSGQDGGSGVARYELRQQTDGGPWVTISNPVSGSSHVRGLAPGHTYRFSVRAVDRAGNVGSFAYGSTFRVTAHGETSASIRYTRTWSLGTSTSYWGGKARSARTAGATATFTFTGKTVGWVSLKAPNRGRAAIYVNGTYVTTVDLKATSTQAQRVVWSRTWTTSARRTVTIRVLGTSGRPTVTIDGFVVGS